MKKNSELYREIRVRFGSVPVSIDTIERRYLAMMSAFRSVWRDGLLIRRSWVRNPPGSSSTNAPFFPVAARWRWGTLQGTSSQNQGGRYGSVAMRKRTACPPTSQQPNPTVPDLYANSLIFLAWRFAV